MEPPPNRLDASPVRLSRRRATARLETPLTWRRRRSAPRLKTSPSRRPPVDATKPQSSCPHMEPMVESRLGRRRSAATKGRGGCSGHGEVHVPALTSPRTPSTPQSQQAPSSMPYPPELQHRPPNPPWNFYPPGGFVNLINQPYMPMSSQPLGENFHFVGLTQNFDTSPLPAPSAKRTPNPPRLAKETIEIDGDGDPATEETKVVKKRYWTHDEEVRLASAWLNSSNDPINGNDKKGEAFWKEIA